MACAGEYHTLSVLAQASWYMNIPVDLLLAYGYEDYVR